MKRFLFILCAIIPVLAISAEKKKVTNRYVIQGINLPSELDGDTIFIVARDSTFRYNEIVNRSVIHNGQFSAEGEVSNRPTLVIAAANQSTATEQRVKKLDFILEAGIITLNFDSQNPVISGTSANKKLQKYKVKTNLLNEDISTKSLKIYETQDNTKEVAKLEKEIEKSKKKLEKEILKYIKDNINSDIGATIFFDERYNIGFENKLSLIAKMPKDIQAMTQIAEIGGFALAQKKTNVGATFTDLKGRDIEGDDFALSDVIGKGNYVVVLFWASWCPPCHNAIPELIDVYNQNKGKGLEIVGVSIDQNEGQWKEGAERLKIPWYQLSDLKGWKSEVIATYGITEIPYLILIDKKGTIVARGINNSELVEKLKKVLK